MTFDRTTWANRRTKFSGEVRFQRRESGALVRAGGNGFDDLECERDRWIRRRGAHGRTEGSRRVGGNCRSYWSGGRLIFGPLA